MKHNLIVPLLLVPKGFLKLEAWNVLHLDVCRSIYMYVTGFVEFQYFYFWRLFNFDQSNILPCNQMIYVYNDHL